MRTPALPRGPWRLALLSGLAVCSACAPATATNRPRPPPASIAVTVQPPSATVGLGGSASFSAVVTGTAMTGVSWSVVGDATAGQVTGGGLYTAPSTAGTYQVVATSVADPTRRGIATVTVLAPGGGGPGTDVPAGAVTTRTWTAAGSPYRILGDVFIPSGHRLTIQPGVEVRFQGHYRLEGPGVIDARGTSPARRDILFTAEDPVTGWYGILIWNGTGELGVPPDVSDYHLENCVIEYVVKDRSNPRAFGDAVYSDSRGALYVFGATSYSPGAPEDHAGLKYSDLHLDGLLLRHNRALHTRSPQGMGGGIYFNTLAGGVEPVWNEVVFDDNQAVDYGGAIAMHHAGPITFRGGAMTNNLATIPEQPGTGGAIGYWDVAGPITLDHVVYAGNVPPGFATDQAPDVVVVNPP